MREIWHNLLHVVKPEGKNCKSESDFRACWALYGNISRQMNIVCAYVIGESARPEPRGRSGFSSRRMVLYSRAILRLTSRGKKNPMVETYLYTRMRIVRFKMSRYNGCAKLARCFGKNFPRLGQWPRYEIDIRLEDDNDLLFGFFRMYSTFSTGLFKLYLCV